MISLLLMVKRRRFNECKRYFREMQNINNKLYHWEFTIKQWKRKESSECNNTFRCKRTRSPKAKTSTNHSWRSDTTPICWSFRVSLGSLITIDSFIDSTILFQITFSHPWIPLNWVIPLSNKSWNFHFGKYDFIFVVLNHGTKCY